MRYFLQNIAQSSPMRTISCVLIGFVLWIVSMIQQDNILAISATLILTSLNSFLLANFFNRSGITKLFSPFVASTYWLVISALPIQHGCWQAQLVAFVGIVIALILSKSKYQDNVTEEAFLSTLICCFVLPTRVIMLVCIGVLWVYLIFKGWMTWRVLAASLMAIALRVIFMTALHYFGWMEWLWMENIPSLLWHEWVVFAGAFWGIFSVLLLTIRRPSTASGIIYLVCVGVVLTLGVLQIIK